MSLPTPAPTVAGLEIWIDQLTQRVALNAVEFETEIGKLARRIEQLEIGHYPRAQKTQLTITRIIEVLVENRGSNTYEGTQAERVAAEAKVLADYPANEGRQRMKAAGVYGTAANDNSDLVWNNGALNNLAESLRNVRHDTQAAQRAFATIGEQDPQVFRYLLKQFD
jgi:hypothetical protein